MSNSVADLLRSRFAAAAEAAAQRPGVDPEMAREAMREAAEMLYNGLALDGLDEQDVPAVIDGLCAALVAEDPGAAVRDRADGALAEPGGLRDPEAAAYAYLASAAVLRL